MKSLVGTISMRLDVTIKNLKLKVSYNIIIRLPYFTVLYLNIKDNEKRII